MRKSINNKMASSSRFDPPVKQKKVVLTVENKLEIIDLLRKGTSYTVISEKYGIGRSTITNIKNNEAKLKSFKEKMTEMGIKEITTKSMKIGAFEKLDEALYIWFRQQREKDMPISGSLLTEKAKVLYGRLYPDSSTVFCASTRFKWQFCKRHNLLSISIQGEQGSADVLFACEFQHDFSEVLSEYSTEQVFNCDETRCFTRAEMNNLPVVYKAQKNAWVNCTIFSFWFHEKFVPHVQEELRKIGKEPKAVLIMHNCAAHPDEELLISRDGLVKALFLPPNVTSLILLMDQGVLEALKWRYRKSLLRDILLSDDEVDIAQFLKAINMKHVIEKVAVSWDEISADTIRKSWRKLVPLDASENNASSPDDGTNGPQVAEFLSDFEQMGQHLTEQDVSEWLEADCYDLDYEHLDDDGIVNYVLGQSDSAPDISIESDEECDDDISIIEPVISNKDAVEMLDKCLSWLQSQPEATPYNTSFLLSLKELAANKQFSAFKQTTLTSYFTTK